MSGTSTGGGGGWSGGGGGVVVGWSRDEEKAFEEGIAMHWNEECREQSWTKIASMVPTKSILELKHHYHLLLQDVAAIEAGTVPLPNYNSSTPSSPSFISTTTYNKDHFHHKDNKPFSNSNFSPAAPLDSASGKGGSKSDQERRKGIPFFLECRLFLLGLDKFGKGDWRSISRNFVISRTPTQVASHAQKYFIRLNSMNRDRRSSIHDIISVNGEIPANHMPLMNGQNVHPPPPAMKNQRPNMHGLGMYGGAPVGQPVAVPHGRHMASAVGTPVMMPPGHHHHHQVHHHPPYVLPVGCPMPPPPPPPMN